MVIMEKGESLDEWQRRCQPDFASSMHIMLHLVERVECMHKCGVAHRDLKPANGIDPCRLESHDSIFSRHTDGVCLLVFWQNTM